MPAPVLTRYVLGSAAWYAKPMLAGCLCAKSKVVMYEICSE